MIIQFCGLSGAGKSTLANKVKAELLSKGLNVEIIDGDVYRATICKDLGFSKADREENIRRLAFIANRFSEQDVIAFLCAINPYDEVRKEVSEKYKNVKTVFIDCTLDELVKRDPKGLYQKALLPDNHPDKIQNFTGITDPFEPPQKADLIIETAKSGIEESSKKLVDFIEHELYTSALSRKQRSNSRKFSFLKAISYRIFGTLATMAISFIFTKKLSIALSIGFFDLFSKIILYYIHDRIWSRISERVNPGKKS